MSEQDGVHPALWLLLGALALLAALIVLPLWSFIFGGLIVGFLGHPIFKRLHRWSSGRRALSAAGSLVIVATVVLVPVGWLGYHLVRQAQELAESITLEQLRGMLAQVTEVTQRYLGWPQVEPGETAVQAAIDAGLPRAKEALLAWLPDAAAFLGDFFLGVSIVLFIGYYALRDGDRLVRYVEKLLPLDPDAEERLFDQTTSAMEAVVFGQVATAGVQGIAAGIGLWLFGVPAPIVFGFVCGALSLLPFLGSPVVYIPASGYLLATGQIGQGLGLLAWGLLFVASIDNVLKPKLMGGHAGIHPTVALVGVVGGLIVFGFLGFILGPIVLTLFLTVVEIYKDLREDPPEPDESLTPAPAGDPEAP